METKIIISIEELDMLIRKVISEELVKFEESKECKYITRTEAAKILKITLPTLFAYCKQGKINIYEIGTKQKLKLSEVQSFVKIKTYNKKTIENGN